MVGDVGQHPGQPCLGIETWRRQYRNGELGDETPVFIPLTLSPEAPAAVPPTASMARRDTLDIQLEIVLRNGRRLLFPSTANPEMLARLLPVLDA